MRESQPRCRLAYVNSSSTYWVQSDFTEQSLRLHMGLGAGSHLLSLVLYSKGVQSTSSSGALGYLSRVGGKTNFHLFPTMMLLSQPTF